ncbi:hypothetical protein FKW77_000703 [Venturia effusa]|uniref:Uncharacterized protein n=1 Tax=Venturia effusa TaxID=50376 RepID=A0A517L4U4_9PEZI|nr:hypothetical protein FKW77_000703 [Venturia effusa]
MATPPSVEVLCALPMSDIYDQNHRAAYYLALGFVVLAPVHRWLTPAALSFVVLYSLFSTLYIFALFIAPTRLGPTLDVFPLHSLLLVNTYALAAVVFCRSSLIRGRRAWVKCMRMFVWQWGGFMVVNWIKMSFEKVARSSVKAVQCHAENTSSPANLFSIGHGFACENPCATSAGELIISPAQAQIRPVLWGTIDAATKKFTAMPRPELTSTDYAIVILFGIALSSTLWLNFFTSPQITRNAVFATLTHGKADSRVRVGLAKIAALTWYTWSYLCIATVGLALPFVGYVQEAILSRYPVANNTCIMKQWLPWAFAVALALIRVAAWRRRKADTKAMRACRIRRFNAALRQLQGHGDHMPLLPEHSTSTSATDTAEVSEKAEVKEAPVQKSHLKIADVRKIDGFMDGVSELKGWWVNPAGNSSDKEADKEFPTADEEKALLANEK